MDWPGLRTVAQYYPTLLAHSDGARCPLPQEPHLRYQPSMPHISLDLVAFIRILHTTKI